MVGQSELRRRRQGRHQPRHLRPHGPVQLCAAHLPGTLHHHRQTEQQRAGLLRREQVRLLSLHLAVVRHHEALVQVVQVQVAADARGRRAGGVRVGVPIVGGGRLLILLLGGGGDACQVRNDSPRITLHTKHDSYLFVCWDFRARRRRGHFGPRGSYIKT